MEHDDDLLARVASGAEAARVAASRFGAGGPGPDPGDVVVWLGDVVDPTAAAVAAAVVRLDATTAAATVRAASAPTDHLAARLAREVAALAAARGCTTIAADAGVPGRWTVEQ